MNFFRFYKYCLLKHPVKTKAITNGIIYSVADVSCQKIENKEKFNKNRTFVFWLFGTFMSGPCNHYWMLQLNKIGKNLIKNHSKINFSSNN